MKPELLLKYDKSPEEKQMLKSFKKTIDPDILKLRKRILNTESDFIPSVISEVRNGFSPIIIVCGRQRMGKSKFALFLAWILEAFLYYRWFDMERNLFFSSKELIKSIGDDGFQIKIKEEAGGDLNKKKFLNDLSYAFDEIIQTQGYLVNIYIFVLPFASDLVRDIRKYVDYICYVKKRGMVRIKRVYKKEDQLISDLKAFGVISTEDMLFNNFDVPKEVWKRFEVMSFRIKALMRRKITSKMKGLEDDWLDEDE
jgi:hypothetical protein